MALDFPTSPTNGQVYGNFIWSSAKGAWQAKPITGKVTTSATAPSAPSNGDEWFNTNDGNIYVYYTDVDGSQWVQVKSDATLSSTLGNRVEALEAKPTGFVPIVPTSVTVGSGSASVNATGMITYTGASSLNLNGLFTSTYPNYRIVFQHILSSDTGLNLRLRVGGVDNTSAVYNNHHVYWGPGGNGVNIISNHTVFGSIFGHGKQRGAYEINAPQLATRTGLTFFGVAENAAGSTEQHTSSALHKADNQFDGVTIYPTGGTFAGTVQVYGYRQDYSMPLDFPTSPTNGQAYQGYVYNSSITAWQAKPAAQSPFYTRDTPPSNPVAGDSWFNTNDGTMYIYYNDGNTSQWTEHRSQIAKSQVGLVPLSPTSVTLTSGTASVAVDGTITLNGCGDAILNGIFNSSYRNYRIVMNMPFSGNGNAGAVIYFRFSSGGTTNSSNNYTYTNWYTQGGAAGVLNGTGTGTNWGVLGYAKDATFEVGQPANASTGTSLSFAGTYNHTLMIGQAGYNANAAFDGIQFANNFYTGTVKVYGYN